MFKVSSSGSFKNFEGFAKRATSGWLYSDLERFAQKGLAALRAATPTNSGITAASWAVEVYRDKKKPAIVWYNKNEITGENVAVLIQYGHGTRNGGYVQGIDFINPAIQPVFNEIANEFWKKVAQ
jgi:hypothetical protein